LVDTKVYGGETASVLSVVYKKTAAKALERLSPRYISQLESGNRTGSLDVLRALASALRLDLDDLTPWRQD